MTSPLPTTLVLDPARPLLHRGPLGRVVGSGPDALVVEELVPPLVDLLDALQRPAARDALLARATAAGADPVAALALLTDLHAAGVVVDARAAGRVARRRAGSAVLVDGDGPLAVGVARGLAVAGVGAVEVVATGSVHADDLGTGYDDADRGRPRTLAAAAAVRRAAPQTRTRLPARTAPDLVVLADAAGADPVTARTLVDAGTAHLQVRLRDGRGVVGPLVLPGRSACLECLDRRRAMSDESWPLLAPQLAAIRGRGDPATAAATAGLATAQALALVDAAAAQPAAVDATLELDATGAALTVRRWSAFPGCPCGAAAGWRSGDAARAVPVARRSAECTPTPARETMIG